MKSRKTIFTLYKDVVKELESYERSRGGSFGIAVNKDEDAIKWQGKRMRLELLEAWLEERTPNWFYAYYLPISESQRRNLLQVN